MFALAHLFPAPVSLLAAAPSLAHPPLPPTTTNHRRFNKELAADKRLVPDGFVYLRAEPSTCIQRLRKR